MYARAYVCVCVCLCVTEIFFFFLQSELWERGKNRLSITSQQIKEAISPSHTTEYDRGVVGQSSYYGEISSDEESLNES